MRIRDGKRQSGEDIHHAERELKHEQAGKETAQRPQSAYLQRAPRRPPDCHHDHERKHSMAPVDRRQRLERQHRALVSAAELSKQMKGVREVHRRHDLAQA